MPKLISIKRPFAKKTADVTRLKEIAELMKSAESSCTELAKVASKIKRILKSSDAQKLDQLDKKIKTLKNEGNKPNQKDIELYNKLEQTIDSKTRHLLSHFDYILKKSMFFQSPMFTYGLQKRLDLDQDQDQN